MQIDNQIASHRWRLRRANSYHIPDGTLGNGSMALGRAVCWQYDQLLRCTLQLRNGSKPEITASQHGSLL